MKFKKNGLMRKIYIIFKNEKMNALRSQLSWTHYR